MPLKGDYALGWRYGADLLEGKLHESTVLPDEFQRSRTEGG